MTAYNVVNRTAIQSGQPEDVSQVLANFDAIAAVINGNLDDANIKAGANIDGSKLLAASVAMSKLSGPYSAYVPAWGSTGVAPVLGNGALTGRFIQVGKFVHYVIVLTMGSTTTFGTGEWFFSLPVASNAAAAVPVGTAYISDASAATMTVAIARMLGGSIAARYSATWPNGVETGLGAASPFAWAVNDVLSFSGVYEAV